jgi:Uma2 family endonuclease
LARRAGLVVTGPFNLGTPNDYRVPDRGLHHALPREMWVSTAAMVVEVLSPGVETWAKLAFYAAHQVDEVLVVDGKRERLTWLGRRHDDYAEMTTSALLDVPVADVAALVTWPSSLHPS